ncbi:MAG TPA: helix-turn-helix transcriptional regulator, partial [Clostridia bacterium]
YVCMDMILDMARFVEELDGNIETLSPEILDVETLLNNMASKEQFAESIKKIILNILNFRDSKIVSRYENTIRKAKGFIDSNYPDPNLSLNNVAEHVNVSPSHFSTIFSQETGETFIEYLTKVRMKKAMEFLRTTTLKSSEIGYKVGYSDPHYFSYLFKKTTGATPKEFRNE